MPNEKRFVASTPEGSEAGFLSIEDFEFHNFSLIQTIFVLPEFRSLGLGNVLLSMAEELAQERGYPIVWLRPRSLDPEVDEKWLIDWYAQRGYEWSDDGDHMEKTL